MSLKLFRTTGYSTLLRAGEERMALHPAWLVLAVSAWIAVACNVGLWRLAAAPDPRDALAFATLLGGGSGIVLSLLGWRRTLRLTATVLLIAGALLACGLWVQELPVATLWQDRRPRNLVPPWPSFLRWQVLVLVVVLALIPVAWVWNVSVRRLPGPAQFRTNLVGALVAALVFGVGLFLLP